MGVVVVSGAQLICPFGSAPCVLQAGSQSKVFVGGKPAATMMDVNLGPFGMCMSMANPAVASATAAALGVLTPQPCTFVPMGPWRSGKPTVILEGKAVLTNDSSITCGMGMGNISIVSPGQTTGFTG